MSQENEEMRPEYDIRGGVRGKHFEEYSACGRRELVHVVACEWVQPQTSESRGKHPSQSTVRIGAEPIYVMPPAVLGKPVLQ